MTRDDAMPRTRPTTAMRRPSSSSSLLARTAVALTRAHRWGANRLAVEVGCCVIIFLMDGGTKLDMGLAKQAPRRKRRKTPEPPHAWQSCSRGAAEG